MGSPKYDDDGLRRDPTDLRQTRHKGRKEPRMWFYEEADGLTVVCSGAYETIQGHIPKKRIREWLSVAEQIEESRNHE